MKKIVTLCLLCATTVFSWAQVGIGTTNPQEALHIAGNDGSIRIDGLNSSNNTKNMGGTDMYNVVVDADGNLALADVSGELSSEASMVSPVVIQTAANSGMNSNELYSKTFTLTQRALVVVTYHISMEFENYDGSDKVDDGRAKIAHNYWYLGDGTSPDTSKSYGMTSSVYFSSSTDTASGYIYNSRSVTIPLDAGTYSIHLNGAVYGGGLTSDAAFRVTFGDLDRLDINAIYL
ncbi:MAG: hypothetical protein KJO05_07735 [Bacteroidia bacterium]|nr:hypothetical protein [Bacteroidia bacterium]NNF31947.1 hypothetical protein [Flavobacteriaceae bacterium]MBT8275096.1 hypothetical protein [Bacteroidia bacterium]NNJ81238.1 hypothetical protein [Flavobacteriaceae bacterium]NNK52922.1 hypothetical protein [Flavobacteriaceae bacterium]